MRASLEVGESIKYRNEIHVQILILSQYWFPENGVPQRRWCWLADLLIKSGHSLSVVTPPPSYPYGKLFPDWQKSEVETGPVGETIYRSSFRGSKSSIYSRVIAQVSMAYGMLKYGRRVIRQQKVNQDPVQLVIGTVPALPTALVSLVLSVYSRAPLIIDLRDAWPELLSEAKRWNEATGHKSFRERILSIRTVQIVGKIVAILMHFILKKSDGIIVTSESHRAWLERHTLKKSKHETKVAVIRNVFPNVMSAEHRKGSLQRRRVESSKPLRVLYAGTIGRAQMLGNVLSAADELRSQGVEVHLRFLGGGVGKNSLRLASKELGLKVEFLPRVPVGEMSKHYAWSDTALVHLADWGPLKLAVPSKTYELMEAGVHITGVVDGETADLIKNLNAGSVVSPNNPTALAKTWFELSKNRSALVIGNDGAEWIKIQRDFVSMNTLQELVREVVDHK